MNSQWGKTTWDKTLTVLSLVMTPLIVFVSSSNGLYLKNQEDLAYQVYVLFPFLYLFLFMFLFGLFLFYFSRYRMLRILLFGYYLLGPFFLIYSLQRDSFITIALSVLLFFIVTAVLYYKVQAPLALLTKLFGFIAVVLLLHEAFLFATQWDSRLTGLTEFDSNDNKLAGSQKKMPNIYHIVFDAYQTDMFELTLSPELKKHLSGFIYFPENTTLFGWTRMSLASIFLGKPYDYNTPQIDYQMAAYNSRDSFLYWLVTAGYDNYAFSYPVHKYAQKYFNHVISHKSYAKVGFILDNKTVFRSLWLYANLPSFLAERLISLEDVEQIRNQNFLPDSAPLISYASFQRYLETEKYLSQSGRYTFIHLLIPHSPNILHTDCSYGKPLKNGKLPKTTALEQSQCCTKMILDFVTCLKELNRFDSAMIVILADHGSSYKVSNNKLINVQSKDMFSLDWNRARSRALLLVKPPRNKRSFTEFRVSHAETTLLDIAPTILDAVDIQTDLNFAGVSLIGPESTSLRRKRYYHFFKKKRGHEWTDEMVRFVIEGSGIKKEKIVKLTNTPPSPSKRNHSYSGNQ